MSYVAPDVNAHMGTVVGNGQCVAYVQRSAGCPQTSKWAEGAKVRGLNLAKGTAIATFQNGVYGNHTDGRSHAAIFIGETKTGLIVHDQWSTQPVHEREIRFKNGADTPNNDGDAFSVVEDMRVLAALGRLHVERLNFKSSANTHGEEV